MWFDIEVGKDIRIRNSYGQELDRRIVSIDEKTITYQRHEVEEGKVSVINKKQFMKIYEKMGVPYVEGQYGDRTATFLEPDIEFDDEQGQLTLFHEEEIA